MSRPHRVLLVAPNAKLAETLSGWLESAGYDLTLAAEFEGARRHLSAGPDVLITALKLGQYNGLHLALRAHGAGIPAVVVGPVDPVLARDAGQLGAVYLSSSVRRGELVDLVARLCATRPGAEVQEARSRVRSTALILAFPSALPV